MGVDYKMPPMGNPYIGESKEMYEALGIRFLSIVYGQCTSTNEEGIRRCMTRGGNYMKEHRVLGVPT